MSSNKVSASLATHILFGIDAVAVDVLVDATGVKLVEPTNGRCLRSVKPSAPAAEKLPTGSLAQGTRRERAPERFRAVSLSSPSPLQLSDTHITII
jgi:hypothetical protein